MIVVELARRTVVEQDSAPDQHQQDFEGSRRAEAAVVGATFSHVGYLFEFRGIGAPDLSLAM